MKKNGNINRNVRKTQVSTQICEETGVGVLGGKWCKSKLDLERRTRCAVWGVLYGSVSQFAVDESSLISVMCPRFMESPRASASILHVNSLF